MANKHERLTDLVDNWRDQAKNVGGRINTSTAEDMERKKTLEECARDVEGILKDNTKD